MKIINNRNKKQTHTNIEVPIKLMALIIGKNIQISKSNNMNDNLIIKYCNENPYLNSYNSNPHS